MNEAPFPAHGTYADGFLPVARTFATQLADGAEIGAGFTVYHRGRCVVDLHGGLADVANGKPFGRDTRVVLFSVTKGLAAMAMLLVGLAAANADNETISVNVDQAKLVKLPGRVATLVVGNPLIADVTLQSGGMIVVTGKGYGATNVIAMDRAGDILVDRTIQVGGPADNVVTVYRGVDRESYSCMPVCQHRVTLGDSEKYFKSALEQAGTLTKEAAGGGTTGKGN